MNKQSTEHSQDSHINNHHWKARLIVSVTMLVLGFIGLVLTNVKSISNIQTWYYWIAMGPIFGVMTIWLSWHLRRHNVKLKGLTLWHDCLHWIGLIGAMLVMHVFILTGVLGRFEASFVALDLLALACFTSGIYFDSTFIIVGISLGIMATIVSVTAEYIAAILFVILFLAISTLVLKIYLQHRQHHKALS